MQYPYSFYETLINDVYSWRQESPANTIQLLAEEVGVRPTVAYNWFEWNEEGDSIKTPIPISKLSDVCNYIGRRNALQVLCNEAGGFFVPHPKVPGKSVLDVFSYLSNCLHGLTGFIDEVRVSYDNDKKFDHREAREIESKANGALAAIAGTVAFVKEKAGTRGDNNG